MRVLVVEDQALIALKLSDSLHSAGHQVIGPAYDSTQARSLMASESIDMAFVDVDLEAPLAGLDLSKDLVRSGVPVIFTTAQPDRVRESGAAVGLVTKPYDADQVADVFPSAQSLRDGDQTYTRSTVVEWLDGFSSTTTADESAAPILLVEDHPNDIELSIAALEMSHIPNPIIVARDGQEALDQLMDTSCASLPKRPAFVLLDLKMPRVNGFDVLRRVRSVPELRSLPIVVFTSSRDASDITRSYEEGASAVITKPCAFEEFKTTLGAVGKFWTDRNLARPAL